MSTKIDLMYALRLSQRIHLEKQEWLLGKLNQFLEENPLGSKIETGVCLWLKRQGAPPSTIEFVTKRLAVSKFLSVGKFPYVDDPGEVTSKRIEFVKYMIGVVEKEISKGGS